MINILFFIESLSGGGAEKVLTDIVTNIDKSKYDITVCTVTDEDIYQDQVNKVCHYRSFLHKRNYCAGGIRKFLFWLGIKFIYKFPSSLIYRVFIRKKYDIEIAFVEGFATKLISSSFNSNSKKIAWVHTDIEQNTYADSCFTSLSAHKKAYNKYSQIICVSESVRNAFINKMGIRKNVYVQYNPVDECKITAMGKEYLEDTPRNRIRLCSMGRLTEIKGYARLLKCIKRIIDEKYDMEFWILGDGIQKDFLTDYIDRNNLTNNVKLLGFQINPYKYVTHCDAFICSSYVEGFSTAATESLILGKPIFTVECAGMHELFGTQHCGEIVKNTDEALYMLLKQIVTGEIDINAYKNNIEARAQDFRIKHRITEIEKLFSTI